MLSKDLWLLFFAVVAFKQGAAVPKSWSEAWVTEPKNIPLVKYGDKSYFLGYNYKVNFIEALQFCNILHMKLVNIESEEEHNEIKKFIIDAQVHNTEYWTSGSNVLDHRNFVWISTGKTLNYTNWSRGEPSYSSGEKCIQLLVSGGELYWNDRKCDAILNFICERKNTDNNPLVHVITHQPSYSPNLNLFQFNGKSYYFSKDYQIKFLEAVAFCKAMHMSLATIDSAEENEAIQKYIRSTDLDTKWWISGTKLFGDVWTWFTTGQHIEFTKWEDYKPGYYKCLGLTFTKQYGLFWSDFHCDGQHSFICEQDHVQLPRFKRDNPDDGSYAEQVADSDEDWKEYVEALPPGMIASTYNEQKKFHVETELRGTQLQAQVFCEYHRLQLVTIESDRENKITTRVIEDVGDEGPFWIGARKPRKHWKWIRTNQPLNNTHLEPGADVNNVNKKCLSMSLNGEWRAEDCQAARPFICEGQESVIPDTEDGVTEEIPPVSVCPQLISKVCAVKPIVNVYINNNLVASEANSVPAIEGEGHKADSKYSVDINNFLN